MNKQILFLLLILLIVIINIVYINHKESFTDHKINPKLSKETIKGKPGNLKGIFKLFNSQLLLGTKNSGNSGKDVNNEVQLYLGGKTNYGANNGRLGHTTYKLKVTSYSKNVYPIYSIDSLNKEPDFYIFNGDKNKTGFLKTNVKVKKDVHSNKIKTKIIDPSELHINKNMVFSKQKTDKTTIIAKKYKNVNGILRTRDKDKSRAS